MFCTDLESFICVAECGSFNKASELLFVSANAIKKRIISLENETGVRLFNRTVKGVSLTPAGKAFYNDAKTITENYKNAIVHAKNIQEHSDVIKIGISKTFLHEFLMVNWFNIREKLPPINNQLFFYGTATGDIEKMIKDTAFTVDIAIDLYDEELAISNEVLAKANSKIPLYCGIPKGNPLSEKTEICSGDLTNETLVCLNKKRSKQISNILSEIEEENRGVKIEEIDEYNIQTLNNCLSENKIILLAENWVKLYPFFSYVPFNKSRSLLFGIYYSKHLSKKALNFIDLIKDNSKGTNF